MRCSSCRRSEVRVRDLPRCLFEASVDVASAILFGRDWDEHMTAGDQAYHATLCLMALLTLCAMGRCAASRA